MRPRITQPALIALCLLLLAGGAAAQTLGSSARLTGMGNSSSALVTGMDAVGVNPALIPPGGKTRVSFAILPFSADGGTDFIDYDTYTKYFTGIDAVGRRRTPVYLTDDDKTEILAGFPGTAGAFRHDVQAMLAGAVVALPHGAIALSITERSGSNGVIPRDAMELALFGNPPGKTFDFSSARVSSSWMRSYGLSYAAVLPVRRGGSLALGATARMIHGYGFFELERFNTRFTTDPDSFVISGTADMRATYSGSKDWFYGGGMHYSLFPRPVGNGWGFDVGAHLRLTQEFAVGLSFLDLGSVTWTGGVTRIESQSASFTLSDVSSEEQMDALGDVLNGTETAVGSFVTALPTSMVIGAAYSFPHFIRHDRYLHFAMSIRQGFNNQSGNTTAARVGVGTEFELLTDVAFRLGVNFGGIMPMTVAAGVGFMADNFKLDVGTLDITPTLSNSFTAVTFGVSTHFDI